MNWMWRNVRVSLCTCLGILIMFCSIVGAAEAESGGSDYGTGRGRTVTGARLTEYIGALYFKKYGSLDDSHFETFVEQELPGCSCGALAGGSELVPMVSISERYLIGEGSHRRLSTTIRLQFLIESWAETRVESCEVFVVERLPHGVFADPFELQHLQQRGVFKEASVFGDTNLELPSFLSNRSLVEVHMDVDVASLNDGVDIKVELPLHGRYQPLDDNGYTNVEFAPPDLFLRCKMNDESSGKSCLSILNESESRPRLKGITWSLPSGIKAHTRVVSIVTFSSAILSTLFIVLASLRHSDMKTAMIS